MADDGRMKGGRGGKREKREAEKKREKGLFCRRNEGRCVGEEWSTREGAG